MPGLERRNQRRHVRWWLLLLLAVPLLGGGCFSAGKPLFTVSGPGWQVHQGQALWRPRAGYPELGGDLVVASHPDGRWLVQFAKTPMTLVSAQVTTNRWRIEFPPKHLGFKGGGAPPARFSFLYLPAGLAGHPVPPPFVFRSEGGGTWRLQNTASGESVEGFLTP